MAKLERDAFMERIKAMVGDATDDNALSFIADMTDTFDSLAQPSDWEARYNAEVEAHNELRKQYKERFFAGNTGPANDPSTPPGEPSPHGAEEITYDDLFK